MNHGHTNPSANQDLMKTLGLIGGTSWASTAEYYRIINQQINLRLGGRHSAKLLLYSINFEEFTPPEKPSEWGAIAEWYTDIALRLQQCGADCIVICANVLHMVADSVQQRIRVPLIHIAEVTAAEIRKRHIHRIGLLGARSTMEQSFFKDRLSGSGITTLIPGEIDRNWIHTSIFAELGVGILKEETKNRYLDVIGQLQREGAEGIVFGCTEIPLLIKPEDCSVPVFDTTVLHAHAAVEFALRG